MIKKIAIGSDHAGVEAKQMLVDFLKNDGYEVNDFGPYTTESVDYPDYAKKVAKAVQSNEADCGILLCGSGIGVSITANKFRGIRAPLCHQALEAKLSRQHNNANVLCLGARILGPEVIKECVTVFLNTEFEGGRHQRRIDKIEE